MVTPQQNELWHDTIYSAMSAVVYALDGPQAVAHALWPARDPIEAGRYLSHCLDPERSEKLSLDEFERIMKWGRAAGVHCIAKRLGDECDYEYRIVEPDERKNELLTESIRLGKELKTILTRLEKIREK